MTAFWVTAALFAPWAAGTGLILSWGDRRTHLVFAAGAGWLLGQAMVMAGLYLTLSLAGASHARVLLALLVAIAWLAWRRVRIRRNKRGSPNGSDGLGADDPPDLTRRPVSAAGRVLLAVVGAGLVVKLAPLIAAHACVPIRNDDAISMWLFKAKVIAGLDELPRDPAGDYYMGGSNPRYPVFAPLSAAWVPLAAGAWEERIATLPWLGHYVALVLLLAGGLRRWLAWSWAWILAYLVASMPLMVIHAYRPGYVDLPLATFLAATVLCLLAWRSTGLARHLALAIVFATATACLKREGPILAGTAVLSVLVFSRRVLGGTPRTAGLGLVALAASAVATIAATVDMADVADNAGRFGYHPDVWPALIRHLFEWGSFHLMGWLIAAGVAAAFLLRRGDHRRPAILLTVALFGLVFGVFLLTPQARFARNDQTPSRLFLQILPAVVVALAIPLGTGLRTGGAVKRESSSGGD